MQHLAGIRFFFALISQRDRPHQAASLAQAADIISAHPSLHHRTDARLQIPAPIKVNSVR